MSDSFQDLNTRIENYKIVIRSKKSEISDTDFGFPYHDDQNENRIQLQKYQSQVAKM